MRFPSHLLFGALRHATFRKQSPPLEGPAFRTFMRHELTRMREVGLETFNINCAWADTEVADGRWDL